MCQSIGHFLVSYGLVTVFLCEPRHDKTNNMACAPREDSDQPRHPPSLTSVFAVGLKKHWVLSYPIGAQQRLGSDLADTQADLSLRWTHGSFCWFCHAAAHVSSVLSGILHHLGKRNPVALLVVYLYDI